ncbi:MAG TPA: tRNA (adenosine(37)-N6)-threonylcarbamoyltransferase complex transferase subunit TsaD [Flavitalea sp.]|nr:tRNA (adenosine(37)-N6)-threonylcarbamoyltransferase complex transferase subunit TsaD [Flavitalea sp.]
MPVILAIESSCDETSVAICHDGKILSNIIATQMVHEKYGGVVPELASRAHMEHIIPVTERAIEVANISLKEIDAVAFTRAPGLIGCLLVGTQFAKSLSLSLQVPLIAVHHMQAHVLSNLLATDPPDYPFLCLTVSGGHTQIVECSGPLDMTVIGETIDDAAGEAFDKSAKLLGLPYPGGPLIDKLAKNGNPERFTFPEPQVPGYDFSFSGLKTSILYFIRQQVKQDPEFIQQNMEDICASVQARIISILINKLQKAAFEKRITNVCIAGGVSANSGLRKAMLQAAKKYQWHVSIPPFEYCTDNAAMIAITAYYKFLVKDFVPLSVSPSASASWDTQ